jgi:hypothetical protein
MKTLVLLAAVVLSVGSAAAHPGIGIVFDSRGNLFYTDLKQVWRVDAAGRKSVAVPNVHTHELYLDASDNLYGEHLWYNGERLNTWGWRVWRRSPDGKVSDVVPAHAGFNDTYSFVRDGAGNMYFAVREKGEIRKRTPQGQIVTIVRGHFRDIRWMTATRSGTVYLVDTVDLIEIRPDGEMRTLARNLSPLVHDAASERHRVMGVWVGPNGDVYVADYAERMVKRVSPRGGVSVVTRSPWPWSPTGGTFDRQGHLWLLEDNLILGVRVRRVP